MSRPKTSAFVIEAFVSSNWHAKRQSTSVVKPDVRFQIVKQTRASSNPTTRSTSTTSCTNPTSRSCWVAELATQEGNVVSVLEAVTVPAVVWIYFMFNSVFYIFDNLSLYIFRKRVFSNHRYICEFVYILEKIHQLLSRIKHRRFNSLFSLFFCKYYL
jgi:hypothetical protein